MRPCFGATASSQDLPGSAETTAPLRRKSLSNNFFKILLGNSAFAFPALLQKLVGDFPEELDLF